MKTTTIIKVLWAILLLIFLLYCVMSFFSLKNQHVFDSGREIILPIALFVVFLAGVFVKSRHSNNGEIRVAESKVSVFVALVWVVLCGALAYYSLKHETALSCIIGGVMFAVWLLEVCRTKKLAKAAQNRPETPQKE